MAESALAVGYDDIVDAAFRLRGVVHRTPVLTSRQANKATNARIFFKCENFQRAGTFKFRGAYNALSCLSKAQRRAGIIVFSAGNYALSIASAAKMLQIPATILMPSDAAPSKLMAARAGGASVVVYDRTKEDRDTILNRLMREHGLTPISAFDHPDVIAGYGTAAAELFDEVGPLDYLFVPVLVGGGLSAGARPWQRLIVQPIARSWVLSRMLRASFGSGLARHALRRSRYRRSSAIDISFMQIKRLRCRLFVMP